MDLMGAKSNPQESSFKENDNCALKCNEKLLGLNFQIIRVIWSLNSERL